MPGGGPNSKVVAANEKKAANQAIKDAEKQRQAEAAAAKSWAEGANNRGASKAEAAAAKADEAARKRAEKVRTYIVVYISFHHHIS
jgi:phage protein D